MDGGGSGVGLARERVGVVGKGALGLGVTAGGRLAGGPARSVCWVWCGRLLTRTAGMQDAHLWWQVKPDCQARYMQVA